MCGWDGSVSVWRIQCLTYVWLWNGYYAQTYVGVIVRVLVDVRQHSRHLFGCTWVFYSAQAGSRHQNNCRKKLSAGVAIVRDVQRFSWRDKVGPRLKHNLCSLLWLILCFWIVGLLVNCGSHRCHETSTVENFVAGIKVRGSQTLLDRVVIAENSGIFGRFQDRCWGCFEYFGSSLCTSCSEIFI